MAVGVEVGVGNAVSVGCGEGEAVGVALVGSERPSGSSIPAQPPRSSPTMTQITTWLFIALIMPETQPVSIGCGSLIVQAPVRMGT